MVPLASIYLGGILTLVIALYHTQLPKKLNWSEEFKNIKIYNYRILYTIHLALTILFFIIGIISLFFARELSESTGLAFGFNLLYSCFWIWRLTWQLTYLKKGKDQQTTQINIAKTIVPFLISVSYLIPVISVTDF